MVTNETPKDIWEFYELVGQIEARLMSGGEQGWAARLRQSLGGSTSGEILTDLGVDFDALIESGVPQELDLCSAVNTANSWISPALHAVGQYGFEQRWCE